MTVASTLARGVMRADDGVFGLRLRSWTDGETRYDLVGDPEYNDRVGRVVCITTTGDPERSAVREWRTTWEEIQPRFGHSMALVQDLDGDLVPEIVVGAPGAMSGSARVHSIRTGSVVAQLPHGDAWMRWGSELSATADGRYVMVAGGTPTVPELLHFPSAAEVHALVAGNEPRADLLRGWSWVATTTANGR